MDILENNRDISVRLWKQKAELMVAICPISSHLNFESEESNDWMDLKIINTGKDFLYTEKWTGENNIHGGLSVHPEKKFLQRN